MTPEELGPILGECADSPHFEGTWPEDYVQQAENLLARFDVIPKTRRIVIG